MSNAVLGQLNGRSISETDLERLRALVKDDDDSQLALFIRAMVMALDEGQTINVFADDAEVSPNEASKLLKMSRPHLLKFMRDGHLPYHLVGSHQRIKMSDLRAFMQAREAGAEILAGALHGSPQPAENQSFSQDELDELNDL